MNTKEISEALSEKYGIKANQPLPRLINRVIRKLPGGSELLYAIEAANAARNHAERNKAYERVIAIDSAIDRLESIRAAMERHILESVGHHQPRQSEY